MPDKNSDLDINTPKGQRTLNQERRAMGLYADATPGVVMIETDKRGSAKIDGVMFDPLAGHIVGVYETKCRNMTREQLEGYGSWLVTNRKVEDLLRASRLLRCPAYGLLYLVPDDALVVWRLSDAEGKAAFEYETAKTKTQRTVNGGTAFRNNAFLPTSEIARVIEAEALRDRYTDI